MSWGTLGKSTCQGERIGNSMKKEVREEKGKCPKATEKKSEINTGNIRQRRVHFPVEDSEKFS